MQREDLLNIVPKLTLIRINSDYQGENPKFGWVDDLDDICEVPVRVEEILSEGVVIRHPINGNRYSVHYSIINFLEESKYSNYSIDGISVGCVPSIDISFFERNCLYDDYVSIKKMCKSKKTLDFNDKVLKEVQSQCPRVIGVLLSNKKLKRI